MRLLAYALALILTGSALAGPYNPGPGSDQVVDIWEDQALTTTPVESALSYPVGLDTGITVDVEIEGAEGTDTVTVTPTWKRPGGSALEDLETPQVVTWTNGDPTGFLLTFSAPRGAAEMFLAGVTSSTNGATITASVIGSTNGVGPVAAAETFSGDVSTTTNGHLTNLGYDGLLFDKDDTDTGITNPAANKVGIQVGGTERLTVGPPTGDVLKLTAGTLSSGQNAVDISGTLPDSAGTDTLVSVVGTGAVGNAGGSRVVMGVTLNGDYSGGNPTFAGLFSSSAYATGTGWYGVTGGNFGVLGESSASTNSGAHIGVSGIGKNSTTLSIGSVGQATTSSAGDNVGGVFLGLNGGAGTATGAYIGLDASDPIAKLTDAGLIVSNAAIAAPIQIWLDDGTTVGQFLDGGDFQLEEDLLFDGSATSIGVVSDDLTFTDANAGTKTLTELAAGGGGVTAQLAGGSDTAIDTVNASITGQLEATIVGDTLNISGTSGVVVQEPPPHQTTEYGSTTTTMPGADTLPTTSHGAEFLSVTFTPRYTNSRIHIEGHVQSAFSAANTCVLAIFVDSETSARAVSKTSMGDAFTAVPIRAAIDSRAGEMTVKVRAGPQAAGTLHVNGYAGTRNNGATIKSYLQVKEVLQ